MVVRCQAFAAPAWRGQVLLGDIGRYSAGAMSVPSWLVVLLQQLRVRRRKPVGPAGSRRSKTPWSADVVRLIPRARRASGAHLGGQYLRWRSVTPSQHSRTCASAPLDRVRFPDGRKGAIVRRCPGASMTRAASTPSSMRLPAALTLTTRRRPSPGHSNTTRSGHTTSNAPSGTATPEASASSLRSPGFHRSAPRRYLQIADSRCR